MRAALLFFVLITSLPLQTIAQGINFTHGSFEEVLAKARQEGKSVFVDCYTSWCGPCKRMTAMVFPDSRVGEFFNAQFVCAKWDMEKDEGFDIAARFNIKAYPTLLFLDGNGNEISRHVGMLNPDDLIEKGKKAADPLPGILKQQTSRFDSGDRESGFLGDYAESLLKSGRNQDTVFQLYLNALTEADLQQSAHQDRIFRLTGHLRSPGLSYLVKNKAIFYNRQGASTLSEKVNRLALAGAEEAGKKEDEQLFKICQRFLNDMSLPDAKANALLTAIKYHQIRQQWTDYDKVASRYASVFAKGDARMLNDIAWEYYMNLADRRYLSKALEWSQTAISIRDNYDYNLTYALILYKLERYAEAEKAADYAIIKAGQEERKADSATTLKEVIQKALSRMK